MAVVLRALRLQEALLGPDHPRLSDTLSNLGLLSLRTRARRTLVHRIEGAGAGAILDG